VSVYQVYTFFIWWPSDDQLFRGLSPAQTQ